MCCVIVSKKIASAKQLNILFLQTVLPLAKLCAMVTMQKRGEGNVQTFSLRLEGIGGGEEQTAVPEFGVIDVTINYRTNILQVE